MIPPYRPEPPERWSLLDRWSVLLFALIYLVLMGQLFRSVVTL